MGRTIPSSCALLQVAAELLHVPILIEVGRQEVGRLVHLIRASGARRRFEQAGVGGGITAKNIAIEPVEDKANRVGERVSGDDLADAVGRSAVAEQSSAIHHITRSPV